MQLNKTINLIIAKKKVFKISLKTPSRNRHNHLSPIIVIECNISNFYRYLYKFNFVFYFDNMQMNYQSKIIKLI